MPVAPLVSVFPIRPTLHRHVPHKRCNNNGVRPLPLATVGIASCNGPRERGRRLLTWAGKGPRGRCKGNGPRGPLTRPRLHGAAGTGRRLLTWAGNGPRGRCKGNGPRGPLTRPRLHGAAGTGPALAHLGRERTAGPMQGERAAGSAHPAALTGPRERAGVCSPGRLAGGQGNGQGSIPLARNHPAGC